MDTMRQNKREILRKTKKKESNGTKGNKNKLNDLFSYIHTHTVLTIVLDQ